MLQLLYLIAFKKQGVHISVVSETLPHLKRGAMRDFFKILITDKLYSEKYHDKTNNIYMVGNSMIEFFSADSGDKVRGARRDYLFINECNNVSFETYNQLEVRTKNQIYLDYNPSHEFWVHEYLLKKEIEHTFIKSTYKDNPYLDANIVKSIESRRHTDLNWWRVFGEGELGFSESLIFTHWRQTKNIPEGNVAYGLDFGYNHPTALIKVTEHDGRFYAEQLIYESHLTNQQLIERLKQLNINRSAEIFADYSRPESIREIYLAGFNIKDANKDVKKGIDSVKSKDLYIHEGSIDLIKELRSYSWKKDRNEKLLEEPIKTLDDACDALRYCIHTWKEPQITFMKPKITTFGKRNTYT
jgi:phage terminase large subunit